MRIFREATLKLPGFNKIKLGGTAGFCERPDGIGLVQVLKQREKAPRLKVCRFFECGPEHDRNQVVHEAVKDQKLAAARCCGVLESGTYSLMQVEPPEVPPGEMRDAVRWQVKDLLDFPLEEAIIDLFELPGQGRGRNRTAFVVAARKSVVLRQATLLRGAKLKIEAIDIPELALRNIATLLPEDEKGVALLHLGRHRGLLTVTRGATLYLARNIPLGLADLLPSSERSGQDDPVGSVALEVQRSLDFYESNFSRQPVAGLVLAPLELDVPPLLPALRNYLGAKVRALDFREIFEGPEIPPAEQARCLMAVGAALRQEQANQ